VCTALEEHLKFCAAAPTDLIFRSPEGGPVRLAPILASGGSTQPAWFPSPV
jgi:hypothetical protein